MSFPCSFKWGFNQTAVYWAKPTALDGYGGATFPAPVEVDVRWEQRQELFIDANAKEVRSNVIVYIGQDVDLGGYLYLGDLDDLSAAEEADPHTVDGAYEIRGFNKSVSVKGDTYLGKVWL